MLKIARDNGLILYYHNGNLKYSRTDPQPNSTMVVDFAFYEYNRSIYGLKIVKNSTTAIYTADVVSYADYSPYGTLLGSRHGNDNTYRYGFQGQERDDEIKGDGNSLNYEYRMHDPRIGRFFAVDPLAPKYPYYSPYQFSGNRPIDCRELEGLEPQKAYEANAAFAIESLSNGLQFGGLHGGRKFNNTYWDVKVNPVKDENGTVINVTHLRLKDDVSAFDAIGDIIANPGLYNTDCAEYCIIANLYALSQVNGKEKFDNYYKNLTLRQTASETFPPVPYKALFYFDYGVDNTWHMQQHEINTEGKYVGYDDDIYYTKYRGKGEKDFIKMAEPGDRLLFTNLAADEHDAFRNENFLVQTRSPEGNLTFGAHPMGANLTYDEIRYRLAAYTFYPKDTDHVNFDFEKLKNDIPLDYVKKNIKLHEFQDF